MAKQKRQPPGRRASVRLRDAESLFLRSAESLGRVIGSLQRQLDGARKRLGGAAGDDSAVPVKKSPARRVPPAGRTASALSRGSKRPIAPSRSGAARARRPANASGRPAAAKARKNVRRASGVKPVTTGARKAARPK